jgi:MoxR-like ATPase
MEGRAFARDEDLEQVASAVLAHRLSLSWEARAEAISAEELVAQLMELSASPDHAL